MFGRHHRQLTKARLDRLGAAVVSRAAEVDEREIEAVAASPFLYARVRARIAAERERREAGESWLTMLTVAWRAVPAMGLAAAMAFGVFWFGGTSNISPESLFTDEVMFAANDAGVEHVLFADRDALSRDEVFDTLYGSGDSGGSDDAGLSR
ncbi:MAG: hypothetical protein MSG64_12495 [Pyrinomonadaceae bacterium MAG19_C2-C3]|nr:hypothetical protein [Pyrinomonadaceae bacterium MAG19_C2-C3]